MIFHLITQLKNFDTFLTNIFSIEIISKYGGFTQTYHIKNLSYFYPTISN